MAIVQGVYTPPLRKYLKTDSVATSFVSRVATATVPANYFQLDRKNTVTKRTTDTRCRGICIYPIGSNAADETFRFQMTGWVRIILIDGDAGPAEKLDYDAVIEYRPFILWVGEVTLGTNAGSSAGLGTSVLFADTIDEITPVPTGIDALTGLTANIHSPGGTSALDAFVAFEGISTIFDAVTFEFDLNAGSGGDAAGMNLLIQSIF